MNYMIQCVVHPELVQLRLRLQAVGQMGLSCNTLPHVAILTEQISHVVFSPQTLEFQGG